MKTFSTISEIVAMGRLRDLAIVIIACTCSR
jgi:hypothetical protein